MIRRYARIPSAALGCALLAALLACACDPATPSVPDIEADAGVRLDDPAQCPYAPEPLGACEPSRVPAAACTVDIEGATFARQRTFLADGTQRGETERESGRTTIWFVDPHRGTEAHEERDADGCVTSAAIAAPLGPGWLTRERAADGESCTYEEWAPGGTVRLVTDPGCDCRDTRVDVECDRGVHGRTRCVFREVAGPPGSISVLTFTYDDAGHQTGIRVDEGGDGVVDQDVRITYDADGNERERLTVCLTCEPRLTTRETHTVTVEGDLRRVTLAIDTDGRRETLHHSTYDAADRPVLVETPLLYGEAVDQREETVYDADGGYVRTASAAGQLEWTEAVVVDGQGRMVESRREQADGALLEQRFTRDGQGLIVEQQALSRSADGMEETCAVRFAWSGACPTVPPRYAGERCWGQP